MTKFISRIDGAEHPIPRFTFCDAWLADGHRFGNEIHGMDPELFLGRWPAELDTDAIVRLAESVGEGTSWDAYANTPPVAQNLAERAREQPLDLEIRRHLQHLQHVCHNPRLHLRLEEERVPVSRARRIPVRAVAELVAHPGDWEHRTLRSIQPSRVLARQVEDEWNLYENRVAARLVDHLLEYLAKRLEELRRIAEVLDAGQDFSNAILRTSQWRAKRLAKLWSDTLRSEPKNELRKELEKLTTRLDFAQRSLQNLYDAPLYVHVPRQQAVGLALKPTNILVNDTHYRKVAALWRAWVSFGHKHQETIQQRNERRRREALAWDQFVLRLVVRGFRALGWSAKSEKPGWSLNKVGWLPVRLHADAMGIVNVSSNSALRFVPVCADLTAADAALVLAQLKKLDAVGSEIAMVHLGRITALTDADRASGWSFGRRAVLFACSPWELDSEERMSRLLQAWLSREAVPTYPLAIDNRALPVWPGQRDWLRHQGDHVTAFRAPNETELSLARAWSSAKAKELEADAQRAKAAKKAFAVAPREALSAFGLFVSEACTHLAGLDTCPVCGELGKLSPRPGKREDDSDATWWATCVHCASEWGTRRCVHCDFRYRALAAGDVGLDIESAARATAASEWPDRVLGRDVWAQPCAERPSEYFRCPKCGICSNASCIQCQPRSKKT